jgi:hypothetical protein
MCSRIVTVALFLSVAFALPVPVYAGECQAVLVFFDDGRDILDVISLEDTGRTIGFRFWTNGGALTRDILVPIGARARYTITAKQLYNLTGSGLNISNSYVKVGLLPPDSFFSVTVLMDRVTHELHCVTP